MEFSNTSRSPEETTNLGKKLGLVLTGGDVVCLIGDLGVGKTAFAQGVGEALGVEEYITSPTFTMIQEYSGHKEGQHINFIHMDLYRLRSVEEAEAIGFSDYFQSDNICLIEWPDVGSYLLPDDRLDIVIEGSGQDERQIIFVLNSDDWFNRLGKVF